MQVFRLVRQHIEAFQELRHCRAGYTGRSVPRAPVQQKQQEAVLKATAVRSPLPVMLSILPCPPCLLEVMQTQV